MVIAALSAVTKRIVERSKPTRETYLNQVREASDKGPKRSTLTCGNLAHGMAACGVGEKTALSGNKAENLAIVTSYNDMLSAHQPFGRFPEIIKQAAQDAGGVAQIAAGVPAMCDGVTQGQKGMELSLFSRDIIALSTAIGLSHNMFDGGLYLGVCDKIVPGLLIGALSFGHLPAVFVPAGPMPSGLPNGEKVRVRQLYAEGKIGRDELLEAESASYHSPRHMHILRHGKFKSNADGIHGTAFYPVPVLSIRIQICAMRSPVRQQSAPLQSPRLAMNSPLWEN